MYCRWQVVVGAGIGTPDCAATRAQVANGVTHLGGVYVIPVALLVSPRFRARQP